MRVREMTWLNAMSKIPKRVRHIWNRTTLSHVLSLRLLRNLTGSESLWIWVATGFI